jgi:hypothetical protein
VHYVRFPLGEDGREALLRKEKAELAVDHGGYSAGAELCGDTVAELLADLGEPNIA